MGAGDRRKNRDQHDKDRAGRNAVTEQRKSSDLRQRLGHDAGADNCGDEKRRPKRFCGKAPQKRAAIRH
jgi:hypothetical protein